MSKGLVPERKEMMRDLLLKIRDVHEPVLRQRTERLTPKEVRTKEIQDLIDIMHATLDDAKGVGLAAPQVGVPLRLAVVEYKKELVDKLSNEERQKRGAEPIPFYVVINPRLSKRRGPPTTHLEGCLSLPAFKAPVTRSYTVSGTALNHRGTEEPIHGQAWHARILQHEIDHLNGKLYIDRIAPASLRSVPPPPAPVITWLEHLEPDAVYDLLGRDKETVTVLGTRAMIDQLRSYGRDLLTRAGVQEQRAPRLIQKAITSFLMRRES